MIGHSPASLPIGHEPEPERHTHSVQFYSGSDYLIRVLSRFIGSALVAGDSAIVITTEEHRSELARRLIESGLDVAKVLEEGRYVPLDASEALEQFMVNGWPDEKRFVELIGGIITRAKSAARTQNGRTALFGDMVAVLCERGNPAAALKLEQLWNQIAQSHSLSIMCGYSFRQFLPSGNADAFQKICNEHSAVLPTEDYELASEHERLRLIAEWQHKALALEAEMARRTQLQQAASKLAAIVESSEDGIASKDLNGIIQSWNASAERIFGYKADEIIGKSVLTIIPPELHKDEDMILSRIRRGERIEHFETVRVTKGGKRIDVSLTVSPVKDEGGRIIGGAKIVRDISARKRAERRVAAQNAVTQILANADSLATAAQPILNAVCDALEWDTGFVWHAEEPEGHPLKCIAACPTTSFPNFSHETKTRTFEKGIGLPGRVWESNRPSWISNVADDSNFPRRSAAVQDGIRSAFGFPLATPSGALGVIEFFSVEERQPDDELMSIMVALGSHIGQFIERKTAQEQLRESEQRFRTMAESAADAIFRIDEQGVITFANPAAEIVFGYPPDELVGREIAMLVPHYLRDAHRAGLKRYITTGKKHLNWQRAELVGLHKDGREVAIEVSLSDAVSAGKRVFTGFIRDITERKRTEEMLRRVEKMAATGQLAATIAHEINNPMQALTNLLALVANRSSLDNETSRLVSLAESELSRMAHITRQMLSFYRETSTPVAVNVAEVLEDVLQLFAMNARSVHIKVERRYEFDGQVQGFPGELRQLFANLVSNAIEAVGQKGRICVHVVPAREFAPPYRQGVRIVVADDGLGIKPEVRERIFQPFFTTKADKGTGLGLWVVKGIVAKHEGSVRLRSSVRKRRSGTVISVFFPTATGWSVVSSEGDGENESAVA